VLSRRLIPPVCRPAVVTLTEDARREAERLKEDKVKEAEWLARHVTHDPELQQEWIRQDNLAYGGLIAIGIVLVQTFVAGASLDTPGMICAVAWAVAIPLLAALVLVNRQETFRGRRTSSRIVAVARAVAQASAFVGLVAGFWHIHLDRGRGGAGQRPGGGRGPLGGVHAPGTWREAGVPGGRGSSREVQGARGARRRRRVAPHRGGDRHQRLTGEHPD
jgi:hypothetical protein